MVLPINMPVIVVASPLETRSLLAWLYEQGVGLSASSNDMMGFVENGWCSYRATVDNQDAEQPSICRSMSA